MFFPSLVERPEGEELRVEELETGLYSFPNSYNGEYEYFEDRPIQIEKPGSTSDSRNS